MIMKSDTSLIDLVLGLICFFGGVYFIFQNTQVSASWGFYIGHFHVSSGMVILQLLMGIVWKVIDYDSKGTWFLIGLGILFILLTIIMGVRIRFITTSLFDYILMFGLTALGLGFLLRSLVLSSRNR